MRWEFDSIVCFYCFPNRNLIAICNNLVQNPLGQIPILKSLFPIRKNQGIMRTPEHPDTKGRQTYARAPLY